MNTRPIPPPGFIPVDSKEAKAIADDTMVNYVYIENNNWIHQFSTMWSVRNHHALRPEGHRHVQRLQRVEWEKVWTVDKSQEGKPILRKMGAHVCGLSPFTEDEQQTIVQALNQRIASNG